jgi:hypothetical protein
VTEFFFVPGVDTERVEQAYVELAREVGRPVPPINARIESITFAHDKEEWTATVGHQLHGVRTTGAGGAGTWWM